MRVVYEVQRSQYAEARFTVTPEEDAAFRALPEADRDDWLREKAEEHALYEDEWDSEVERVFAYAEDDE